LGFAVSAGELQVLLRIIQVTENFTGIHHLLDPTASAEVTRTSKPIDGIGFQP